MIEINKNPQGSSDAGMFNLPPAFDTKKYAAEWVENSQVVFKQQRQPIVGTNKTADGWTVWKANNKDAPTTVQGSGSKKFTLMCRPREIQDQVNALYGDVSKIALNREITGTTVTGLAAQDPGMLSEQRLRRVEGGGSAAEESVLPLNENVETAATT